MRYEIWFYPSGFINSHNTCCWDCKNSHYAGITLNKHKSGEDIVQMPDVKRDYIFFNNNSE